MSAARQLQTMGDLFARHQARQQAAPVPAAPPRATAPARPRLGITGRIERIPRGAATEFRVNGQRFATVAPAAGGFLVTNHEAGHKATVADARLAEAMADRIARLAAMPMGRGAA